MIKLILITFLASGGYIERVTPFTGTFEQCEQEAQRVASSEKLTYCVEYVRDEK